MKARNPNYRKLFDQPARPAADDDADLAMFSDQDDGERIEGWLEALAALGSLAALGVFFPTTWPQAAVAIAILALLPLRLWRRLTGPAERRLRRRLDNATGALIIAILALALVAYS